MLVEAVVVGALPPLPQQPELLLFLVLCDSPGPFPVTVDAPMNYLVLFSQNNYFFLFSRGFL